jgi:hypothetical protein
MEKCDPCVVDAKRAWKAKCLDWVIVSTIAVALAIKTGMVALSVMVR